MDAKRSPLPLGWYTPGGHQDFWGDGGTYELIPFECLPSLDDTRLDGSFDWLQRAPQSYGDALGFEDVDPEPQVILRKLAFEVDRSGLALPSGFVSFLTTPNLHNRVPSCTACYLSLSHRLIDVPGKAPGRLLRFMNDQQCVLLWYLYLEPGQDAAVAVGAPHLDEEEHGESLDNMVALTELYFCAPTFEEFIYRLWLENTIWYSLHEQRPLTSEQSQYVNAARRVRSEWRS